MEHAELLLESSFFTSLNKAITLHISHVNNRNVFWTMITSIFLQADSKPIPQSCHVFIKFTMYLVYALGICLCYV